MPITSGSPTQIKTSVDTKAELSGTPADQFDDGDSGWVKSEVGQPHGPFYAIQKSGGPPVDGTTVLAVFEQPTQRWVSWSLLLAGAGTDRFAPRYLVGNVPAGDPAVPAAGAFRYIPDPGDATGIAQAVAEALVNPGPIYLRPGTYDWNAGPLVAPLTLPDGVILQGSGIGVTTLIGSQGADQGVIILAGRRSAIQEMTIQGGGGPPASASDAVVLLTGLGARMENVRIYAVLDPAHLLSNGVRVSVTALPPPDDLEAFLPSRNVTIYVRQTPE